MSNVNPFTLTDDLIHSYVFGESEQSISLRCNVSRNVIRYRLKKAGVAIRGCHEAQLMRNSKMSAAEKIANVSKAHEARRGQKDTKEILERRASQKNHHIGRGEIQFMEWLNERGFSFVHQCQIGKYNVDIGSFPIAVELYIGPHNPSKSMGIRVSQRSKDIRNRGWHIINIWITKKHFLTKDSSDQAIVLINELSANPAPIGQEWVIRGDGQSAPVRSF